MKLRDLPLILFAMCGAVPVFAQGLDLSTQNGLLEDRTNAGTTGTTLYTLTKINSSGQAVIAATTDSNGIRGVCVGGCGTSGSAQIATTGTASLLLDGTGTVGDYVQISGTTGGYGHDTGATTCPSSGQTVGKIVASGGPSSSYYVALGTFGCGSGGGAAFQNVYTGHGTYTWNKPSGITWVGAYCLGAGGGGNSGVVGTSAFGGSGGGGGAGAMLVMPASLVGSSETVTIGQGGAGGATSTNATYNIGGTGGNSSFGSWITVFGGKPNSNGFGGPAAMPTVGTVSGSANANINVDEWAGRAGPGSGSSNLQGYNAGLFNGPSGGASVNGTGVTGGNGGITPAVTSAPAGGASTATTPGSNGMAGANPSNIYLGSAAGSSGAAGGACGGSGCTAGNGGNGGYGAGGGGGGPAISTTGTAGSGGNGGDGVCIVWGA